MQTRGCVYHANGSMVCVSLSKRNNGNVVETFGTIPVIFDRSNYRQLSFDKLQSNGPDVINSREYMFDKLDNYKYYLLLNDDGNLEVRYYPYDSLVWSTKSGEFLGKPGYGDMVKYVKLHSNGELIVYACDNNNFSKETILWRSMKTGKQGNYVLYITTTGIPHITRDGMVHWAGSPSLTPTINYTGDFPAISIQEGSTSAFYQGITYIFSNQGMNHKGCAWLFDRNPNTYSWFDSLGEYNQWNGEYRGRAASTNNYPGAWFQMQTSVPITITGYVITQKFQYFIEWVLWGSNDGQRWDASIHSRFLKSWQAGDQPTSFTDMFTTTPYKYFRFVIMKAQPGHTAPCIQEFVFKGYVS